MPVKKKYLKSRPECKTTFTLPREAAAGADRVTLVGDFNAWDEDASPMRRLKNGSFTLDLNLACGRAYQYRFLMDGKTWENDWAADRYVRSPMADCDNSVVVIEEPV